MAGNLAVIDMQLSTKSHNIHIVESDEQAIICSGLIAQYAQELKEDHGF